MTEENGSANIELGPDLIGYTDRFSVAAGEPLQFMVSSQLTQAEGRLVRLFHGDEQSPIGLVEQEIPSALDGAWELEEQAVWPGSFGLVEVGNKLLGTRLQLSGHLFVSPTLATKEGTQGLLAQVGRDRVPSWELVLEGGDLVLRLYDGGELAASAGLERGLRDKAWHSVSFAIDLVASALRVWSTPLAGVDPGRTLHASSAVPPVAPDGSPAGLLVAASRLVDCPGEPRATGSFNGKIERPVLFSGVLDDEAASRLAADLSPRNILPIVMDLDLGADFRAWNLVDRSAYRHPARLYNAPQRLCTSHTWGGEGTEPALAPDSYAAIHFHDDDVHHANWLPTRAWTVPSELPSGVYALRLRGDGAEDRLPFIVRPPRDRATAPVALLLSTFTYAAYANERDPGEFWSYEDYHPEYDPLNHLMWRHPEWGPSAYDHHSDGSGVSISSLSRPVPFIRPNYRDPVVKAPRHFPADLYLVHFLEHLNVRADVIGDEDVHTDGSELLNRYGTVITSSHPEYITTPQLDAIQEYVDGGGRLMYMGGNGFYWITALAPDEPGVTMEVRRGETGNRLWTGPPGEGHNQFTGEQGGLWRYRGRRPHALVGIGFVGEGWDGSNRPYRRQPASFLPQAAWAFEEIGDDELIGDDGLVMGGAAGDELDSADRAYDTPPETLVLASSGDHSDAYWLVVEDIEFNQPNLSGTKDPRIRADITLTPKPNGGAVFSVGSISFTGSLSQQNYENAVARLTENVLSVFTSGAVPWLGDGEPVGNEAEVQQELPAESEAATESER